MAATYRALGKIFMQIVVPDTIDPEVKTLYLDFLFQTSQLYKQKQARRPGF